MLAGGATSVGAEDKVGDSRIVAEVTASGSGEGIVVDVVASTVVVETVSGSVASGAGAAASCTGLLKPSNRFGIFSPMTTFFCPSVAVRWAMNNGMMTFNGSWSGVSLFGDEAREEALSSQPINSPHLKITFPVFIAASSRATGMATDASDALTCAISWRTGSAQASEITEILTVTAGPPAGFGAAGAGAGAAATGVAGATGAGAGAGDGFCVANGNGDEAGAFGGEGGEAIELGGFGDGLGNDGAEGAVAAIGEMGVGDGAIGVGAIGVGTIGVGTGAMGFAGTTGARAGAEAGGAAFTSGTGAGFGSETGAGVADFGSATGAAGAALGAADATGAAIPCLPPKTPVTSGGTSICFWSDRRASMSGLIDDKIFCSGNATIVSSAAPSAVKTPGGAACRMSPKRTRTDPVGN